MSEEAKALDAYTTMYHPELAPQGKVFEPGQVVPDGWYESPADWSSGTPWQDGASAAELADLARKGPGHLTDAPTLAAAASVEAHPVVVGSGEWCDGVLLLADDAVMKVMDEHDDPGVIRRLVAFESVSETARDVVVQYGLNRLAELGDQVAAKMRDAGVTTSPEVGSAAWAEGVLEGTIQEVEDALAGVTDPAAVKKVGALETVGADRRGVAEAVAERLGELEGSGGGANGG